MRYVTVCENLGEQLVPGSDHKVKYARYQMVPGTAWRINDETKEHEVVEIKEAGKAKYLWILRWIDGRTVAAFLGPNGKEYAQPVSEDPRARERRLGSARKLRKPRREAPGVAPEVPSATSERQATPEADPSNAAPHRRRLRRRVLEPLG